jgi:two-component system, sporulation sensor kinase E
MYPEDVSIPLRETVALVRGVTDASSIDICEEYPPAPLLVNMDHNEIKQVFINIVNNALQAMPHGGELRIGLRAVGEGAIVAQFSDTGTGIAPEHIPRIFEPFFSTKDNGAGTGLGLSISYRIIQNHGGRIEADSTVGKGTTFKVYLPQYQEIPGGAGTEHTM